MNFAIDRILHTYKTLASTTVGPEADFHEGREITRSELFTRNTEIRQENAGDFNCTIIQSKFQLILCVNIDLKELKDSARFLPHREDYSNARHRYN
jgi:hypothetical protein